MGVQGLTSLLQRESRPSVKCIHRDHPIQGHPKILLVDASTVQYSLVQRVLGTRDAWAETNWHQRLYLAVSSFYQAIISTGLIPVLILDGAQSSSNYQTHADRKRNSVAEKEWAAPLAASICKQAYLDLGLEIETSVLDADRLLIAWYR